MRALPVMAVALVACGGARPAGLTCKDATAKQHREDRIALVGTCEVDAWPEPLRRCVLAATGDAAILECFASAGTTPDPGLAARLGSRIVLAKLDELAAQMCACKDTGCVDRVQAAFKQWSDGPGQALMKERPDPETMTRMNETMATYGGCMATGMANEPDPGTLAFTSITPTKGDSAGGTYVMLRGSRFLKDGPRNVKVYFGSRQGTVVRFHSDRELIVQAPGGKPGEVVDVLVIFDPGGSFSLKQAFEFVEPAR